MPTNTGLLGERLVLRSFKQNGHIVLEHGSRSGKLELDLYTRDFHGVFHLVEVKTAVSKICQCGHEKHAQGMRLRRLLPSRFMWSWSVKLQTGELGGVSHIDARFNREKMFHMKQLAQTKIGKSLENASYQIDYARVELCATHRFGIITLFENVEM